jgi:hypothetical protein
MYLKIKRRQLTPRSEKDISTITFFDDHKISEDGKEIFSSTQPVALPKSEIQIWGGCRFSDRRGYTQVPIRKKDWSRWEKVLSTLGKHLEVFFPTKHGKKRPLLVAQRGPTLYPTSGVVYAATVSNATLRREDFGRT